MSKVKRGQVISFFCRPCGDYHYKDHPHYRAMKRRKAKRIATRPSGTINAT
jgi:hypothetical protein